MLTGVVGDVRTFSTYSSSTEGVSGVEVVLSYLSLVSPTLETSGPSLSGGLGGHEDPSKKLHTKTGHPSTVFRDPDLLRYVVLSSRIHSSRSCFYLVLWVGLGPSTFFDGSGVVGDDL